MKPILIRALWLAPLAWLASAAVSGMDPAPTASAGSPAQQAQTLLASAQACLDRQDLACALDHVVLARAADPVWLPAQQLLGQVLLSGGHAAAAQTALGQALQAGASPGEVAAPLARALLLQGQAAALLADPRCMPARLGGAQRHALQLVRAEATWSLGDATATLGALADARLALPGAPQAWWAEVPVRLQQRQWDRALAAAEQGLKLAPANAEGLWRRATVHQAMDQAAAALADLDAALAADAAHTEARLARAHLLMALGRAEPAARDLADLLQRDPHEPRANYLRAWQAQQGGDGAAVALALKEVSAQLDAQPAALTQQWPSLQLLGGMAHFGLGNLNQAAPYLDAYAKTQSEAVAGTLLAQWRLQRGKPEQAVGLLERHLREHPRDAQALDLLARAHLALGRNARAQALAQQALQVQDSADARATLAWVLLRDGRLPEAVSELQSALRLEPSNLRAAQGLIELYLQTRQAAQAQSLAAALVQRAPQQPLAFWLQGRAAAQAGDLGTARQALMRALQLSPGWPAAHLDLARVDIQARAWTDAHDRLTSLLGLPGSAQDAHLEMARMAELRGQPEAAQDWLERAITQAGPLAQRPTLALVDLQMRRGQAGVALATARELGLKTPEEFAVQLAISRAALAAGDASEARRALVHAGRLAGLQPQTLASVASLQLAAGDATGAAYSLGKALKVQPDMPELQALMAQADLAQAAPERAQARALALVQQYPDDARGHSLLGQVAQARGQWPQALAHRQRAHQLAPSSQNLLQLHTAQSQVLGLADAAEGLTQWLKTHPDDQRVRNALAETQVAQRQWAAARSTYNTLLAQSPAAHAVRNNLAHVLMQLGDASAQGVAEQALAADPANGEFIDTAGWAAFKSGQTDLALERLRDARVRLPASAAVRYHLAAVLAKAGRVDDARHELSAALASNRPFEERADAEALLKGLPATAR